MNTSQKTALAVAVAVFALHAAFSTRYGYLGDELYFIACAKHLALGYVDQPPLVALAAWLSTPSGYALWLLRLPAALCAGGAVYVTSAVVRYLGGSAFAQITAGLAVALAPSMLYVGSTLTTQSFEPLTWALLAYAFVRLLDENNTRWWIAAGVILGCAFWAKYTILTFALCFIVAMLTSDRRRLLFSPDAAIGAAVCVAIASPNLVWQAAHGFPMFAVVHGDVASRHALPGGAQFEFRSFAGGALSFVIGALFWAGIFAVWLWVVGFGEFKRRNLFVFTSTFGLLFAGGIVSVARGYYIVPFVTLLYAFGALALDRMRPNVRKILAVTTLAIEALFVPFFVPILPVQAFAFKPPAIADPVYADQLDWEPAVAAVARVYQSLPPATRSQTAIYADDYAYAGAIDLYGWRYGLPNAISGHDSYWVWGPRDYTGASVVAVGATQYADLTMAFADVKQVAVFHSGLRSAIEGPLPIYLCTQPRAPFSKIWPRLKRFGG